MMYMLTGNYKADQVHVPALLERLGQYAMMTLSLDFAPLTAWWLLALVCLPAVALIAGRWSRAPAARSARRRGRGARARHRQSGDQRGGTRAADDRRPADRRPQQSQKLDGRTETADAALEA
jgi:hypothetical protein